MKLKRRSFIRLILFSIAAVAILFARNFILMKENSRQKILIKNNYTRALEDLALAADNINSTLEKQLYSGTPKQQSELADKLFKEASSAKAAMLQLPLQELELENTYKYLSQVGNYSRALAEKTSSGKVLTREEYNNLKVLHEYAKNMCDKIWEIEKSVSEGEISIDEVGKQSENNTPNITEGFSDFEEGFSSYPTLIYDGPFSDHIMQKEPLMTKGAEKVTEKKALQRCTSMLGISSNDISLNDESEGKLPTYIFTDKENSISCAVTKRGGMVSYFIKSRDPEEATLSTKDAVGSAEKFLSEKGYGNMKVTYYERINNICTVNFAYEIDGVTCYTDLIKVSVALDNGEVLGFDASGYIVNHKRREFPEKVVSEPSCESKLSTYLECYDEGKALIPTEGGGEAYCYEYKCKAENNRDVLVYFNAETGEEEQILILLTSKDGTLAI